MCWLFQVCREHREHEVITRSNSWLQCGPGSSFGRSQTFSSRSTSHQRKGKFTWRFQSLWNIFVIDLFFGYFDTITNKIIDVCWIIRNKCYVEVTILTYLSHSRKATKLPKLLLSVLSKLWKKMKIVVPYYLFFPIPKFKVISLVFNSIKVEDASPS